MKRFYLTNVYAIVILASLSSVMNGVDSGIITSTLEHPQFFEYFFGTNYDSRPNIEGLIVTIYLVGEVITQAVVGLIMNKISRKRSIRLVATLAVVGCTIQTASINLPMLLVGRFISGLAIGMEIPVTSTYCAELAPPEKRAVIIGVQGLLRSCGYTLASWVGFASSYDNSGEGTWRIPLAMQLPIGVTLIIITFFLPFSPRWLAQQGRYDEALETLIQLHSKQGREFATKEFIQIREQIILEDSQLSQIGTGGLYRALFSRKYRKQLAWVVFTQVASGLSGSTVAASYQGIMFGIVGFTGRTTLLVSALYGFMGPAASLINILFIADKWGRRTTMWVGYASLTVCLSVIMLLCGLFATNIGNTYQESVAAVAFFFLFSGCISFSLENTPAVICTELLPYLLRGVGFGMGYFASSCVQIMINQVSPIIFNQISYKYYAVYIFCDIVSTFVYFFLFKETKGKTLEEIGALFGEEVATKNINEISLDELEVGKNETEHKELV